MAKWAETQDVMLVPLFPALCNMESCAVTNDKNEIIYIDRTHFNEAAKPLIIETLRNALLSGIAPTISIQSDGFSGDISGMTDAELIAIPDKFEAIKLAMLSNDTAAAERVTNVYLDTLADQDIGALIRKYYNGAGDASNRRASLLLAQKTLEREENTSARYLLGLSYFRGVNVSRDDAIILSYWDHPSFAKNGAVQFRLSEKYGNPSSSVYDPEKAANALAASEAAGYIPK